MNNCYQCEELISAYLEKELNYHDNQQLDVHLQECPSCLKKSNNIRLLRQKLASLPTAKVSSDFDSMLRARIRLEQRMERHKRESLLFSWKLKGPILGLSMALFIFVLLTVYSQMADRNTYSPVAAVDQSWENKQFVQQNAHNQGVTIYWIDRKPAFEIITKQPSSQLKAKDPGIAISPDSSTFVDYGHTRPRSAFNLYPTSF
jgi:hypothetical protein